MHALFLYMYIYKDMQNNQEKESKIPTTFVILKHMEFHYFFTMVILHIVILLVNCYLIAYKGMH